jgi:hypothetical protein
MPAHGPHHFGGVIVGVCVAAAKLVVGLVALKIGWMGYRPMKESAVA